MKLYEYLNVPLNFKEFLSKYKPNINIEKNHAEIKDDLYPDFETLKANDFDVIRQYTTDSSKINRKLWMTKVNNETLTPNQVKYVKSINKALNKLPDPTQPLRVYSGVRRPSNPQDWLNEGGIVNIPSFLSCTLNPRMAGSYVDYSLPNSDKKIGDLLVITIRPHQEVGGYVETLSHKPDDYEFLIKANFILKLVSRKPQLITIKDATLRVWNAIVLNESEIAVLEGKEKETYLKLKNQLK